MDRYALTCPCSCHGRGMDAPCDWDGGCGHLHRPSADQDDPRDRHDPHARRCAREGDCPRYERVEVDDREKPGQTKTIRIGAPLQQERGLCRVCHDVVAGVLGQLVDDYWALYAELATSQTAELNQDIVRSTRELSIPIRTSVRDLAARIVDHAVTWAEPVAEQASTEWDAALVHDHTRPHAALTKAVAVLRWNTTRLIDHEPIEVRAWGISGYAGFDEQDGVEAAVLFCKLHQQVQSVLALTDLEHQLPAPCPRCSTQEIKIMALVRENGGSQVYCKRCNITYAEQDYHRLTLVLAEDEELVAEARRQAEAQRAA